MLKRFTPRRPESSKKHPLKRAKSQSFSWGTTSASHSALTEVVVKRTFVRARRRTEASLPREHLRSLGVHPPTPRQTNQAARSRARHDEGPRTLAEIPEEAFLVVHRTKQILPVRNRVEPTM